MIVIKDDTSCGNLATETDCVENEFEQVNGHDERAVEAPLTEIDEPSTISEVRGNPVDELPANDKKDLFKWTKNFDFLKTILIIMVVIYIIDVIASKGQSSLKEPFFEVLKTILLTAAGYIFAKSENK